MENSDEFDYVFKVTAVWQLKDIKTIVKKQYEITVTEKDYERVYAYENKRNEKILAEILITNFIAKMSKRYKEKVFNLRKRLICIIYVDYAAHEEVGEYEVLLKGVDF